MSDKEFAVTKLKELQQEINESMDQYFDSNDAKLCLESTHHGVEAFAKLREFSQRPGKRVRGALSVVAYTSLGGQNTRAAQQLAIAVELIQNYLLIVDDVMDRSQTRRGGKTVHEQYIESFKQDHQVAEAAHLGNMLGINVGLLGQHLAADIMSRLDEEPRNVLAASSIFHRNIAATCYGQIEDLFNDVLEDVDEAAISRVHQLKNSYYTFINPLQTGAMLAGAGDKTQAAMFDFGIPAGIAFQLRDDIIGLFGSESETGKSTLDDLREGKMTLLMHHVLSNGSKEQVAVIREALGNEDVTVDQHKAVKDIVQDVGSLSYTEAKAAEYANTAKAVVSEQDWPDEMQRFLNGMVDYIIERNV